MVIAAVAAKTAFNILDSLPHSVRILSDVKDSNAGAAGGKLKFGNLLTK
jgi:hypothetical protein